MRNRWIVDRGGWSTDGTSCSACRARGHYTSGAAERCAARARRARPWEPKPVVVPWGTRARGYDYDADIEA